jgi:hypothetical protein
MSVPSTQSPKLVRANPILRACKTNPSVLGKESPMSITNTTQIPLSRAFAYLLRFNAFGVSLRPN